MKASFLAIALLALSLNLLTPSRSLASLTAADHVEIQALIQRYVVAFDQADAKAIKSCVTADFVRQSGGSTFEKALKKMKAIAVKRQAEDVGIEESRVGVFVHFNVPAANGIPEEVMSPDEWFRLAHETDGWKFDHHEIDFNP